MIAKILEAGAARKGGTCGESVISRYRKEENKILQRLYCNPLRIFRFRLEEVQIVGESKLKSAEIALSRVPFQERERGKRARQATKAKREDRMARRREGKRKGGKAVKMIRAYCRACGQREFAVAGTVTKL